MKNHLAFMIFIGALAACAPSPEERAIKNAGSDVAARIWTEPGVAEAISVGGTFVIDFKPERDALFRSIPMPLGLASYGEFDFFDLVMFDLEKATHAQVLAGMADYCRKIGKRLTRTSQGVMDPLDGTPPRSGHVSGQCR